MVKRGLIALVCIIGVYTLRCVVLPRVLPAGTIDYRGKQIRLSKWYFDYDDYKNDPSNVDASELPRVQLLVRSTPVDRTCRSWEAAAASVQDVRFPGYRERLAEVRLVEAQGLFHRGASGR